jgi:hypothetical protein
MKAHHRKPPAFGFGSATSRDKIQQRSLKSSGTYANVQAENAKIDFIMTLCKKL